MSRISLKNLQKNFADVSVIHGIDLEIEDGEFCVFVGPSGCGKSTLLRMIAGLETISAGELTIDGEVMNDVEPAKRGLAMVFQSYALYPHMNVEQNMGFGLKMTGHSAAETKGRVDEAARILRLEELMKRKPAQLSGGQRQRVAIGRAIVRQPRAFLFDEPLSNLDAELRAQMRVEIARLHAELKTTMIYVTHDQVEAMTMADKIVVLNAGRIEQVGAPMDLYENPATPFVAGFIGSPKMNLFIGDAAQKLGCKTYGIRPEHIDVANEEGKWSAQVRHIERLGAETLVYADVAEMGEMVVKTSGSETWNIGQLVFLTPQNEREFRHAG